MIGKIALKLIMIFILFFIAVGVNAESTVTFEWNANTEADLAGYRIHRGNNSGEYVEFKEVGKVTQYTWVGLPDGTHFFAATAFDTDNNESDYSNELSLTFDTAPPEKPKQFRVTVTEVGGVTIERSQD